MKQIQQTNSKEEKKYKENYSTLSSSFTAGWRLFISHQQTYETINSNSCCQSFKVIDTRRKYCGLFYCDKQFSVFLEHNVPSPSFNPLHSLGFVVGVVSFFEFVAHLVCHIQCFGDFFTHLWVTARTTSAAASRQKKTGSRLAHPGSMRILEHTLHSSQSLANS